MENSKKDGSMEVVNLLYNGKINPYFKVALMRGNHPGWLVSDRYGNNVTGFFAGNDFKAEVYASNKCVAVGKKMKKGFVVAPDSKAYDITANDSIEGTKAKVVSFPYEITNATCVGPNRLLLETSNGYCFVDPSFGYKKLSDFYDRLVKNDRNGSWYYEKEVQGGDLKTTIKGGISLDGTVDPKAYDSFFRRWRVVSLTSTGSFYDQIDTSNIVHDLIEREELDRINEVERARRKAEKNKSLAKVLPSQAPKKTNQE